MNSDLASPPRLGRAYLLDGHLVMRLPHAQAAMVQDLTEAELTDLRTAIDARLFEMSGVADWWCALAYDMAYLRGCGYSVDPVPGIPRIRLFMPGWASAIVIEQKDLRQHADAQRKRAAEGLA